MQLAGSYTFTADPEAVWALLYDPITLSQAMPDCEEVARAAPDRYVGRLHLHAGALQSKFQGTVTMTDVKPMEGYALHAAGQSTAGRLAGTGRVWLEPAGEQTILHYSGSIEVNGEIGAVGEAYLQTVARSLLRQICSSMQQRLQQGGRPVTKTAVSPLSPPSKVHLVKAALVAMLSATLATVLSIMAVRAGYRRWIQHVAQRVALLLAEQERKQNVRSSTEL